MNVQSKHIKYNGKLLKKQAKRKEHQRLQANYKKTLAKNADLLQVPKYYKDLFEKSTTQAPASQQQIEKQKRLAAEALEKDLGLENESDSSSDSEETTIYERKLEQTVIAEKDAQLSVGRSVKHENSQTMEKAKPKPKTKRQLEHDRQVEIEKDMEIKKQKLDKRDRIRKRLVKRNSKGQPFLANQIDNLLRHIQRQKS